jgi:signal transduction histidine kinase
MALPVLPPAERTLQRLEEQLRRRERELQAVRRLTSAIHTLTNLDDVERMALKVAIETVEATSGTIYVHNPERKTLIFKYVLGATPEITAKLQGLEMPDHEGISGEVFHSGNSRITHDVSKESRHNRGVDEQTRFRTKSILAVPLKPMGGHSIGVLQVLNRQTGQFDEADREVLEILAAQAASAIETVRLLMEARRASVINLIGDISHDVKNLLTPVVTGTQTLEMLMDSMFTGTDQAVAQLTPEQQRGVREAMAIVRGFYGEAMGMVYEGAQGVQDRVREIADAIKGIIAEPHFEPSDLNERAQAVARVLKLVAERRDVSIDLSGLQETGPIELDRTRIYSILYNLINNAIPQTSPGGMIRLCSRRIEHRGEPGVELQVEDNGSGMPEHVRELMFTDHAVSTKPGGTGLGSRIVKNAVELHNGTISVDSQLGRGTIFTIRLPMRQPVRDHESLHVAHSS